MTRSVSPKKHLDEGKPTFPIPDPILELQTQFLGQVSKVGLISIKDVPPLRPKHEFVLNLVASR